MQELRTPTQEAAEDIFFGQSVIIWARWFVILAGTLLALWSASDYRELTIAILLIVSLMAVNFFVHGRFLMEKPINRMLLAILSFVDLVIVSLIVWAWRGGTGLNSPYFIFYYPLLLAFAFVFPRVFTLIYTAIALGAYFLICVLADSSFLSNSIDLEIVVIRLITLAAMGGLGTFYWRIQRQRRRMLSSSAANEGSA
jgi:hypothetical protein